MSVTLSKIVMVIALSCLGSHRRDWAFAMMAEFKVAGEHDRPLSFATGCLITALREMPTHVEGRLTLARYGTTLGLVLPLSALLLFGALGGYPFIDLPMFAPVQPTGFSTTGAVNPANLSAVQALTFLIMLLSARLLLVGWFVVERDWARVAATQRFGAAIITTLAIFTGVIVREEISVLLPLVTFAIELGALTALARWHARVRDAGERQDAEGSGADRATYLLG